MMYLLMGKLFIAIGIVLVLPGYFLLSLIINKKEQEPALVEKMVLSVGLSIFVVDFLLISLHLLKIPITQLSVSATILLFAVLCEALSYWSSRRLATTALADSDRVVHTLLGFTKQQWSAFAVLFLLAVLLRTVFVVQGSIPQTTDLGHHMYWAKLMATTGSLPDYGMPDFIIGEHIIFGAVGVISQIDFISAMPVAILLVIHLVSLLAMFLLSYRIASLAVSEKSAGYVGLLSVATYGVFYAISSPQAKFVSGGVIGNIMGNFLMPLAAYCLLTGLQLVWRSKSDWSTLTARFFFFLFFIFSATLAYTHHLTTFVFLFSMATFIIGFIIVDLLFNRFDLRTTVPSMVNIFKELFSKWNLLFIAAVAVLALFFYPPSYLNPSAIDTAVGTPVKETRTGISLSSLALTAGPWRFFYSLVAVMVMAAYMAQRFFSKKITAKWDAEDVGGRYTRLAGIIFIVGWFGIILLMSNQPSLLKVDIPTARIANYISLPASILSAIAIYYLWNAVSAYVSRMAAGLFMVALVGTGFVSGLTDVSDSARQDVDANATRQTYQASRYINEIAGADEMILKDHNYVAADAWIKLFLMRGYRNPLSRSLLKRYNDPTKDRETCTLEMIVEPDGDFGRQCYQETQVRYVMLKPGYDTAQFERSENFSKILAAPDIVIYKRTNE